ncbi:hypothetical protein V8G54_031789 [Vigna mungo]|uniref:PPM-type phosphatase domain-containing protein n=1 Tax=Vigna mungo TaxID=3915 RepID=A0AAQ3MK52_VIGMU
MEFLKHETRTVFHANATNGSRSTLNLSALITTLPEDGDGKMISNSDPVEPLTTAAATSAVAVTASSSAEGQPAPPATPNIVMSSKDHDSLFSGGGIRFSYGYSSFKGKRSSMEDFFETTISEVDGQMVAFFGVFDGSSYCLTSVPVSVALLMFGGCTSPFAVFSSLRHTLTLLVFRPGCTAPVDILYWDDDCHGGSRTAEYLKNNLFKNLSSHPDFIKDTKTAIVEAFKQTDIDYLNEEKGHQRDAGSTASTAMLLGDRIVVANVGDSRVVASRAGSAIPLSIDHKPDRSDERQRIEKAGGFIIWAGTWRVGGVLAVSRAFGDKLLKPYVVADPEIQEEEIDGVDFIIIASDGLWNVISNNEAVSLVQNITDAEVASRELIKEAYARGSSDNITSVVVRFDIS